ncbi:MAG: DUF5305 family protein [Clostridia bacterium]|jgi:hypothetical protein|nr:DUF5305 family protein [Clostridia bacterium]
MKKLSIPSKLRTVLIIIFILLLGVVSTLVYRSWKYPGTVTETVSLYSYSQKANVDYQAAYRDNMLTGAINLEAGQTYITEYLNDIKTSFHYEFTGERPAQYTGSWSVRAALSGWKVEQEKVVTIWKKEYPLVPETPFDGMDASFELNLDLPLDLKPYADFVKAFVEETKISSEVSLIVSWQVAANVLTEKGVIEETAAPTLVIPIGASYFTIAGQPKIEKESALEEKVTSVLPVNMTLIYAGCTGLGLLLIALVLLIFFTNGVRLTDPVEIRMKAIRKKHGERLVSLGSETVPGGNAMYPVKTLEDLIKIADELSKPVLYTDAELGKPPVFYVLDEPKIYLYKLRPEPLTKSSRQEPPSSGHSTAG